MYMALISTRVDTTAENTSPQICFVRRISDGRFLRGSKVFPWVKSWRWAAMLSPDIVRQYIDSGVMDRYGVTMADIELVIEPIRHQ